MDDPMYKRIQKIKFRQFREKLVEQLWLLGYTVIILSYIKYGGNIVILFLRCMIQSALITPFPNRDQILRRFSFSGTIRRFPALSQIPAGSNEVAEPHGALEEQSETERMVDIATEFLLKAQWALFHAVFTFNWLILLTWLIWPTDYSAKLGLYKYDRYPQLANTPSPFNNDNYLRQGEWRGTWFLQYIGEAIPSSNFKGNLMAVSYQFMIFVSQFGLFLLSCVYFSPLRETQLPSNNDEDLLDCGDGYNGNIKIVCVSPTEAVGVVYSAASNQHTAQTEMLPGSMV